MAHAEKTGVEKRTISLPPQHAAYVDELVASGAYGSVSEVVRAGLRALQDRDAAVEKWLREEVVATYDAMIANPERAIPADSVFEEIRRRRAERTKDRK